jgi:hypothetical protein
MKNNISINSKVWLSFIGGIVAIIITFIDAVLINFLDPLKLNSVNPDFAKFVYGISTLFIGLLTIYFWIIIKWKFLNSYGYLTVYTKNDDNKNIGIELHSKNGLDLKNVYIELVELSNLTIGKEHHFFVEKLEILSVKPLKINLFLGEKDELFAVFDGKNFSVSKMLKNDDGLCTEEHNIAIKISGKFAKEEYEFSELYKGSFTYSFMDETDTRKEMSNIWWHKKYSRRLKRVFQIEENLKSAKRKIHLKYNYVRNGFWIFIGRLKRIYRSISFEVKRKLG